MTPGGRIGEPLGALEAELARLKALFEAAGAVRVAPATLQPADALLGLYGEDIRARAFITFDPVDGELILRPDFTAPVARMHLARGGAGAARYAYQGLVWRRQEPGSTRPTEYLQAGMEILGEADAVAADAEIFALIREALGGAPARALIGDLAVALSAIDALGAPPRRRAALRRHLWRPARFRQVLEGFGAPEAPSPARAALLAAAAAGEAALRAHVEAAGPVQGVRGVADVMARARELAQDAATPPLPGERIAWLEAVMAVAGPAERALAALRGLDAGGALAPALDALERRLEALTRGGADAGALDFDASFGRGLEYYDGFVFEFRAEDPALPPLGGGGRYDALTARLGGGAALPAVGGVVRPEAVLAARGGA